MARSKRLWFSLAAVAVVIAAGVILILVRRNAAPEATRLLPDCDAVVYLDLRNLRRLTSFTKNPTPPKRDPEYEEFIRETGFDVERDLQEAAMAVHLAKASGGENRYSEILVGQFDHQKARAYLKRLSRSVETFEGTELYSVPVENRTVRVAILNIDHVAISNADDPAVIRGMISGAKHSALPLRGPSLLADYREVPVASLVWAMARIPQTTNSRQAGPGLPLPGGFDLLLPYGSTIIASVRFLGSVNARAEFLMANREQAQQFANQVNAFLSLFRSIETSVPHSGNDPDVKAVFDSLKVEQQNERTVLSASIPTSFLKKFFSEPVLSLEGLESQSSAPKAPPKAKPKGKRRH